MGKWICAEEESGAIGGPEGTGNRNAATVCKGATERYEGCPLPRGVPNIAQFAPTTDGGFEAAAFGQVTEGVEEAVRISQVPTSRWNDKPKTPVVIQSIRVDTQGEAYPEPKKLSER